MSNDLKLRKTSCISYFCEQNHEDEPGHHKLPTIKECVATIRANTPGQTKIAANSFNLMPKNDYYMPQLCHIYTSSGIQLGESAPQSRLGFRAPLSHYPLPLVSPPLHPAPHPPCDGPTGCMCHRTRLLHESPACAAAHRCSGDVVDEGGRAVRSQRWVPAVQQCCGRWSVGLLRWALQAARLHAGGIHNSMDAV